MPYLGKDEIQKVHWKREKSWMEEKTALLEEIENFKTSMEQKDRELKELKERCEDLEKSIREERRLTTKKCETRGQHVEIEKDEIQKSLECSKDALMEKIDAKESRRKDRRKGDDIEELAKGELPKTIFAPIKNDLVSDELFPDGATCEWEHVKTKNSSNTGSTSYLLGGLGAIAFAVTAFFLSGGKDEERR